MKSPCCGAPHALCVDSRTTPHGGRMRRRVCPACGERFKTYEFLVADVDDPLGDAVITFGDESDRSGNPPEP